MLIIIIYRPIYQKNINIQYSVNILYRENGVSRIFLTKIKFEKKLK